MRTKTRVAVVGAGLAGLAAAYELSKDERVAVELFESNDYLGGRVRSLPVNGHSVDFGGFIVFPWYEQFHRLVGELGVDAALKRIPLKGIYYDLEGDGSFTLEKELDFPVRDTLRLYPKVALGVITENDMAHPNLERYKGQTISEYFRTLLGVNEETLYERFTDTVCQGYCYGAVDAYKMSFVAPIIRFQRLYGDISKAFYFSNGIDTFTQSLRGAIEDRGGVIRLNHTVREVQDGKIVTDQGTYEADKVVFALPANDPLYPSVIPDLEETCSYTHFYTITLRADAIPEIEGVHDWGAVFHRPEADVPYQILSSINLRSLYEQEDLKNFVTFNVVVRDELVEHAELTKQELFEILLPQLNTLFSDVTWEECVQLKHWSVTMPVAQESFVQAVRDAQGKNGYYFAGDYLGAPSMETAITTGLRAAAQLIQELP
jgi:protoporphyrinogen oxidase